MNQTITKVADLLDIIQAAKFTDVEHAHIRFWFRGHADAGWRLEPGVYRDGFGCLDEDTRLRKEQHLSQDFHVMSAGLRTGRETDEDTYFLQQHHRMPTRLLDWSNSPLAALYFAVADTSRDCDAKLFMMDAYVLGSAQSAKYQDGAKFEGVVTSRNPVFWQAVNVIRDWKKIDRFPNFIIPVRPDHFDRRMSLQRSCFTFHVPACPLLTDVENPTLKAVTIPKGSKAALCAELALLGIDAFAIFGDMDRLAETLKFAYGIR